ncbi:L,D-transpeptidase family protein, partial [Sulfobacillus harzensis]
MTQAAVIAFQHQQHLPVNGIPGPQVWMALQQAVRHPVVNPTPYAYIYVSETLPERLWLWVAGHVVLTTLANTGIPETPTTLGSYAVDERRTFQIMRGINPNGTSYADPVHWINYFDKSQAVHGFLRAQYGFPQSLGCVEVPIPVAQKIYPHLYIGALVTVAPPGSAPLVRPNS